MLLALKCRIGYMNVNEMTAATRYSFLACRLRHNWPCSHRLGTSECIDGFQGRPADIWHQLRWAVAIARMPGSRYTMYIQGRIGSIIKAKLVSPCPQVPTTILGKLVPTKAAVQEQKATSDTQAWASIASTLRRAAIHNGSIAPAADQATGQQQPSQQSDTLEGRNLQLFLGPLPLIEQTFSVYTRLPDANKSVPTVVKPGQQQQQQKTSREFRMVAPRDVDEVIDMLLAYGLQDSDPYWTRAWPSAIALSAAILERPQLVAGKRVADLGAGLGVAGLAAAIAGASEVVLLDREPLALQCGLLSALATCGTQLSVQGLKVQEGNTQQGLESANTQQEVSSSQHVICQQSEGDNPTNFGFHGPDLQQYLQEHSTAQSLSNHQHSEESQQRHYQTPRIRGQTFDWNAGPEPLLAESGGKRFDVVLACDVLYEAGAVEPIANLVPSIIKSSGGYLLLADPPNRTAANRQRFVELLDQACKQGRSHAAKLYLEECSIVDSCRLNQLDPEMCGGLVTAKASSEEVVPVQLMVFRSSLGTDTVGLKLS